MRLFLVARAVSLLSQWTRLVDERGSWGHVVGLAVF